MQKFSTGAIRKPYPFRFDQISPYGLSRVAYAARQGAEVYGDDNYRKGSHQA
ncbi:MAG: hypothetical protein NTZ05_10585 [Chloroflexi bacterium]|nr:hypothetical protein [Chloroflexota bacterium]